ncbi:hypothetical protein V5O48_008362, partial [Marasmius crinis-equi]
MSTASPAPQNDSAHCSCAGSSSERCNAQVAHFGTESGEPSQQENDDNDNVAHRYGNDYPLERAPRQHGSPTSSNEGHWPSNGSQASRPLNNHDTLNHGNSNETYNSSVCNKHDIDKRSYGGAVVHVHVHEYGSSGSSASTSPSGASISGDLPTPPSSQPTSPSSSPATSATTLGESKHSAKEMTPSQRYEYLLLDCQLGTPQWKPSPRRTLDEEYMPEIGAVGFFSDGLPFDTLFNITLPLDSPANRDGVPEGVDPPCTIQRRWLSVNNKYHEREVILFRPKGAISQQEVHDRGDSRVFSFGLSQQEGAMLVLPRGGTLFNLDRTTKFQERIKLYWRFWYDFAVNEADIGDRQTLCLVTGIERSSTWAMAVWESNSSYVCDKPGTLELTVDASTGACSWRFPPARCSTQSSTPLPPVASSQLKESVFVRGFWMNRSDGGIGPRRPLSHPGGKGDRNGEMDDLEPEDGSGPGPSSRGPSSSSSSYTISRFSAQTSASGSGNTKSSNCDLVGSHDGLHIDRFDLSLSAIDFDQYKHPCQLINNFALALVSQAHPVLLETGCIAFSHDEDWINIVNDTDAELLDKREVIRRMSSRLKFVVEQDAIFPTSMLDAEKELVQRCLSSAQDCKPENVIAALVELRGPEILPEVTSRLGAFKTVIIDPEDTVPDSSGILVSTSVSCSLSQSATRRVVERHSLDDNDPLQSPSRPYAGGSPEDVAHNVPSYSLRPPELHLPSEAPSKELPSVVTTTSTVPTTCDVTSFTDAHHHQAYFRSDWDRNNIQAGPNGGRSVAEEDFSQFLDGPTSDAGSGSKDLHVLRSGNFMKEVIYDQQDGTRYLPFNRSFPSPTEPFVDESSAGVLPSGSAGSTTSQFLAVPLPDPVERRIVGSNANIIASVSRRKKQAKYFCDVPGCPSQGFTQKHNLE